jgi:hypothetical protein
MAKLIKGLLAELSGKIGPIVAATWKGIPYLRVRPSNSRKRKSTEAQAATRVRFAVTAKFLYSLRPVLNIGFQKEAVRMTGNNSAQGYVMKNALAGAYPDYQIIYSKVLISRGDLPCADTATATAADGGTIQFTWASHQLTGKASNRDKAIMVAYCPEYDFSTYNIGTERGAGAGSLEVSNRNGLLFHTWLGFISKDGKDVATSVYTGEVVVRG